MDTVIRVASKKDIKRLIKHYPHIKQVMCSGDNSVTLIACDGDTVIAFLSSSIREIPAPIGGLSECFINVIEVFDIKSRCQGIGSALVRAIIRISTERKAAQVRAYCEIHNVASHMLWIKNGFGISPVKAGDGTICGSYVTYRL